MTGTALLCLCVTLRSKCGQPHAGQQHQGCLMWHQPCGCGAGLRTSERILTGGAMFSYLRTWHLSPASFTLAPVWLTHLLPCHSGKICLCSGIGKDGCLESLVSCFAHRDHEHDHQLLYSPDFYICTSARDGYNATASSLDSIIELLYHIALHFF